MSQVWFSFVLKNSKPTNQKETNWIRGYISADFPFNAELWRLYFTVGLWCLFIVVGLWRVCGFLTLFQHVTALCVLSFFCSLWCHYPYLFSIYPYLINIIAHWKILNQLLPAVKATFGISHLLAVELVGVCAVIGLCVCSRFVKVHFKFEPKQARAVNKPLLVTL